MKVIIKEVSTPPTSSFTMFAEVDKEKLMKEKVVRVRPSYVTKTRIETSMQIGQCRVGINFAVDGYKTVEKREHNMFSGTTDVLNYFVKSKKQGLEEYKEFVKALVEKALKEYLYIDLDEVVVELEVERF